MESGAVLLMAHGSPASLDDVPAYLFNLRGGRAAESELVENLQRRYAAIGGKSPLLEITQAQAQALQMELRRRCDGEDVRVYVGMRYWQPFIAETLAQVAADGFRRVSALCVVPHASQMTLQAYAQKVRQALSISGEIARVRFISGWETQPLYLEAVLDSLQSQLARMQHLPYVLFTAHSLPGTATRMGEDYTGKLMHSAAVLAQCLRLPAQGWQVCFQSAPVRDGTWLSPYIEDVLPSLAGKGVDCVLAAPIGFAADHLEVLYDLDIEARRQAHSLGMQFERAPSLNTHPLFMQALVEVILSDENEQEGEYLTL